MHRYITVHRVYGVFAALLSVVRLPISNIINFTATGRALFLFTRAAIRKKDLAWEKTPHTFPTSTEHS